MSGFLTALRVTLSHEGGYSDHKADRGGATMWGVTQATYDRWRLRQGLAVQPVAGITEDEAEAIYQGDYWRAAGCDRLPWPISLVVFDCAVNHGPRTAVKLLQAALGLTEDGVVGPITLGMLGKTDPELLVHRISHHRVGFYLDIVQRDPDQGVFFRGWVRRDHELTARAVVDA